MLHRFRRYDAFAKAHEDVSVRTAMGGIVTIVCIVLVSVLLFMEYASYMTVDWKSELTLDESKMQKMTIHFDMDFPQLPCCAISIDILDEASDHQMNVVKSISKTRIDATGHPIDLGTLPPGNKNFTPDSSYCGSCYAATNIGLFGEIPCCNTCDDVRDAYIAHGIPLPSDLSGFEQCSHEDFRATLAAQRNEGCNIAGYVQINKIPGDFHFAPGYSFQLNSLHLHDLRPFDSMSFNMSHRIKYLSFGDYHSNMVLPLNGFEKVADQLDQIYTYFVKVMSTEIHHRNGTIFHTNQFSSTHYQRHASSGADELPGIYFLMDISPLVVIYKEYVQAFSSFVAQVCAIVGGIYTLASLFDSLVYSAEKRLLHKHNLGKAT